MTTGSVGTKCFESYSVFQSERNNGMSKILAFDATTGVFVDKVNPNIDFKGEAVVQCDVSVVKMQFQVNKICK